MRGLSLDDLESEKFRKLAEHFPPGAAARYQRAIDFATTAHVQARVVSEKAQALSERVRDFRDQVNTLLRDKAEDRHWNEQVEKNLERARDRLENAKAALEKHRAETNSNVPVPPEQRRNAQMFAAKTSWETFWTLSQYARFEDMTVDCTGYTIESARAEADAAIAGLVECERSFRTVEEAIEAMRAAVKDKARYGAPNFENCLRHNVRLSPAMAWPTVNTSIGSFELGLATAVWANQDAIIAKLEKEIKASLARKTCIPKEERATRQAELEAAFLQAQRIEAALCFDAAEFGDDVKWRRIAPLAFFGVKRIANAEIPKNEDAGGWESNMPPTIGLGRPEVPKRG